MWMMLSCVIAAPAAEAVMAAPGVRTHVQSDGKTVMYQAHGDEFLHYMTDLEGNLVAFGSDGDLHLARWATEDEFQNGSPSEDTESASRGIGVGGTIVILNEKPAASPQNSPSYGPEGESSVKPLQTPIPQFILDRVNDAIEERDEILRGHPEQSPDGAVKYGAPSHAPAATVTRNLLLVYIRFENEDNLSGLVNKAPTNTDLYDLVFNESKEGSVANYYKTVTGGGVRLIPARETFEAKDDGIIRVTVSGQHENWGTYDYDERPMLKDALKNADPYIDIDEYASGSYLGAEELSIIFIVHGYETSIIDQDYTDTLPSLWGHAWGFYDLPVMDGVSIVNFCAFGAFHSDAPEARPFTIGIVAHEMGHHSFNFKDFYLYPNGRVYGISGTWSLMGSGNWGAKSASDDPGETPAGIDAYHLSTILLPTDVKSGSEEVSYSLTNSSQFVKLTTDDQKQYFLLQPRGDVGYDRGVRDGMLSWSWGNPQGGLMIYHIDENMDDDPADYASRSFFDVEEAHTGAQDLQENKTYPISPNDLFYAAKNVFGDATEPDSKLYDGKSDTSISTQTEASGIKVADILQSVTAPNTFGGTVNVSFKVGTVPNTTAVTEVTLNKAMLSLPIGGKETLVPTVLPAGASDKMVVWSSENPSVATVNEGGLVTAVGVGTAKIKATSNMDTSKYAECTVTVALIPVMLQSATADGSAGTKSTKIDLVFNSAITGLTEDKINIANGSGTVTKGTTVSGSGRNWTIPLTDVTGTGTVTVSVTDFGQYDFDGSRTANVYDGSLPAVYGISLSESGTYTFTSATYGYSSPAARSVTVTNTGSGPAGNLTVGLSGAYPESFTLSKQSITGLTETEDTDAFTIVPETDLGAGTYTASVTVSGENGITAGFNVSFTVNPKVTTLTVESISDQTFTGSQITPTVTVKDGANTLTPSTDYTVAYGTNINAGTDAGNVTVTGVGNYAGSTGNAAFTIIPKVIALTVESISDQTFTGSQITPTVTVKDGANTLTLTTDYTVAYGANINAGADAGSVMVTGIGNYAGSTGSKTFTITKKPITVAQGFYSVTKQYDGTTAAGTGSGALGHDLLTDAVITATPGAYSDANAGTGKSVTISLELSGNGAGNYELAGNTLSITDAVITKATYSDAAPNLDKNVRTGAAGAVTVDMSGLLSSLLQSPLSFGAVTYSSGTVTDTYSILNGAPSITGSQLSVAYNNINTAGWEATINITVHSANYEDFQATVKIKTVSKIDVSAAITFTNGSVTYTGNELSHETAAIQGHSGGTWTYVYALGSSNAALSNGKPLTAGTYTVTATWEDEDNIGVRTVALIVNKAVPSINDLDVTLPAAPIAEAASYNVSVSAKDTISGMGAITVKYNGNTDQPASQGTYAVTADIAEGDNYAAANINVGTFSIKPVEGSIGGDSLFDGAGGTNWSYSGGVLTLTGDVSAIDITSSSPVTIKLENDVTIDMMSGSAISTGGNLTLTGAGKTLTVNSVDAAAITSAGNMVIDGVTIVANAETSNTDCSAIESGGSITITGAANVTANADGDCPAIGAAVDVNISGSANVTAENTGTGDGIKSGENINVSTNGDVESTAEEGYAMNAGDGNGTLNVSNGQVRLYDSYDPSTTDITDVLNAETNFTGGDVYVNETNVYSAPATEQPGEPEGTESMGCNAGALSFLAAALMLLLMAPKRRNRDGR
jgi:M6 family metalloprotease-like protein